MKRFLSALTAFCMCASTVVTALPASAIKVVDSSPVIAEADTDGERDYTYDDFTWYIKDAYFNPETDKSVTIEVCVAKDQGAYTVGGTFTMDGGTPLESGWQIGSMAMAGSYKAMNVFVGDKPTGAFGGAVQSTEILDNIVAGEGETVIEIKIAPQAGTVLKDKYALGIADLGLANADSTDIDPSLYKYEGGTLYVVGGEPSTSEPTEAPPQPTDPQPTDEPTPNPTNPDEERDYNYSKFTWYIKDAYFNPETDKSATIEVCVANDQGAYTVGGTFTMDGGTPLESGWQIGSMAMAGSYKAMNVFVGDKPTGAFGGAVQSTEILENIVAENHETVIEIKIAPQAGTVLKDKYALSIYDLGLANADSTDIDPSLYDFVGGTLYIVGGEVPTDPTDEPTAAPTELVTDATTPTDDVFHEIESQVAAVWDIADVTAKAGETVKLDVTVTGNEGFNSFIANFKNDAGVKLTGSENGGLFANLQVIDNIDKLAVSGTESTTKGDLVGDGAVFTLVFDVPADAQPGKYNVEWTDFALYNADMVKLIPTLEAGSITIIADDTDFEQKTSEIGAKWVIEKYTAEPGELVPLHISVEGDTVGLNSYMTTLKHDTGITATGAEADAAYAALKFEENTAALKFGATNPDSSANVIGGDADVFVVYFQVPETAKPGDHWDVEFADLEIQNIDMVRLIPQQENGWIEIADTETDEPTTEYVPNDAGMWIIGTAEAAPGDTVTLPVYVKGDKNGINSYIMNMGWEGPADVTDAYAGEAVPELDFLSNLDKYAFAGTNYKLAQNLVIPEEGTVFYVTFQIDDDAAPGRYPVVFNALEVFGINMVELTPDKQDGWIEILAPDTTEEPTEPPTDETEPPTDEPTEPPTDETEPPTDEPTEPPTDEPTEPPTDETEPPTDEPTEPPTDETEPPTDEPTTEYVPNDAGMWIIGTAEAAPGDTVTLPVYVKGDKNGINSYIMNMGWEGPADVTDAYAGEAVPELDFLSNLDKYAFAGTNYKLAQNLVIPEEGTVFYVTFQIDDDAAPGRYPVVFNALEVFGINMVELTPDKQDGWIEILAPDTTEEPTEPPTNETEPPTDETEPPTDEPTEPPTDETEPPTDETEPPTAEPTEPPTDETEPPTAEPTEPPTDETEPPTAEPTEPPTVEPTGDEPTTNETAAPNTDESLPTEPPTDEPVTDDTTPDTNPTDEPITDGDDTFVNGYQYNVKGNTKFYFAHDGRPFDAADLVDALTCRAIYTNGSGVVVGYGPEEDADKSLVSLTYNGYDNPEAVYDNTIANGVNGEFYVPLELTITVNDQLDGSAVSIESGAYAYIAVKGDTNLDGTVNAADAAEVLKYSAELGSGNAEARLYNGSGDPEIMELFVYFLSDIDGESEDGGATTADGANGSNVDASDAAYQLLYSARKGAGNDLPTYTDWAEGVLTDEDNPLASQLPKYTRAIFEWKNSK